MWKNIWVQKLFELELMIVRGMIGGIKRGYDIKIFFMDIYDCVN